MFIVLHPVLIGSMEKWWFKHSYTKFHHGRCRFQRTLGRGSGFSMASAFAVHFQTFSRNQWFHVHFALSVIHFAESWHCTFPCAGNAPYLGHALWCSQAHIYFLTIWVQPSLQQDFQRKRGEAAPQSLRAQGLTVWPMDKISQGWSFFWSKHCCKSSHQNRWKSGYRNQRI